MYLSSDNNSLAGDVIAAIAANPHVGASAIRAFVTDGLVRLQGTVDTLYQKQVAEQVASQVPGVTGVENDLTVGVDIDIRDKVLQRNVDNTLASAGLENAGSRVDRGVASLLGSVASPVENSQAIELAEQVEGIKQVISNLRIGEIGQREDDIKLASNVVFAVSQNPAVRPMDLQVRVDNGFVMLTGEVPDQKMIAIITQTAELVPGVLEVDNRFTVRPLRAQK